MFRLAMIRRAILAFIVSGSVAGSVLADSIFDSAYYLAQGSGTPESVDCGDLNGDGLQDVAMVNFDYSNSTVDIYIQQANHTLLRTDSYSTSWGGRCVAIGDVNGDGRNDLIFGSYSNNPIYLRYQQEDTTFGSLVPIDLGSGVNPHVVACGDFDSNGRSDVAACEWSGNNNVYLLYQQEDGTLSAPESHYAGQHGWNKVFTADLNDDALDDLVVMNGQYYAAPNVSVLYQDPNTHELSPALLIDLPVDVNADAAAAGDVNNDGLEDLLFATSAPNTLYVYYQQPDHTLPAVASVTLALTESMEAMEIADVNLDGLKDVICGIPGGDLHVLVQNPDNTLNNTPDIYTTFYQTHIQTHGMKVGDMNFDGGPDVLFANSNYGLVVLKNRDFPDCNANATPDVRDLASGITVDRNGNGVPDDCDCPGDFTGDGTVDLEDLHTLLVNYESPDAVTYVNGDTDLDGDVDDDDLLATLETYGMICEWES